MRVSGPAKQLAARLKLVSWLPDIFYLFIYFKEQIRSKQFEVQTLVNRIPQTFNSES